MHDLAKRAHALGLYGLILHLDEVKDADWVPWLIGIEEVERKRRSLEQRLRTAKLGRYKPISDFDWDWPKKLDRGHVDELFTLKFVEEGSNIVIVGPNGVGKTMMSKNIAHKCLHNGFSVRFTTASVMLNVLAAEDSASALERRLRQLCRPRILCIDEVGYLSYGNRHADLLFEVVTRRYELGKPVIVTTNKAFAEWGEVFPNASCVVTLVDRLVHRSEVLTIAGNSYRLKEAQERKAMKRSARKQRDSES